MDKFTRAYIQCALWASTDESTPEGGEPMDQNYSIDDITPASLAIMQRDCDDFQLANHALLHKAYARGYNQESAGYDFWLTRNGHGAGYWDRGLGKLGDDLSAAAKQKGSCNLCVNDNNRIVVF